jgi:hypothetical protein
MSLRGIFMPLGAQLCPLGLFYAPWGSSARPPSSRAHPHWGVHAPSHAPPSSSPHLYALPFHPFVSLFHPCTPLFHPHAPLLGRTRPYGSRSRPPESCAFYKPCNIIEAYIQPSNVAATVDKVALVLSCQRSTWRWPLFDGQEPYRTWRTDGRMCLSVRCRNNLSHGEGRTDTSVHPSCPIRLLFVR